MKICGLRATAHVETAAKAGADFIGLVFAPSRRRVTIAEAAPLVRAAQGGPQVVGLFVNATAEEINRVADRLDLDMVQLSGDEPATIATAIERPLIKALRGDGSSNEAAWLAFAEHHSVPVLFDAHVPGSYGGTGVQADWQRAAELARCLPLILAGGLNPVNVAEAIARVRPFGVDVSSGVEIDGTKDSATIEAFIAAARTA